jgi:hypothetical protein
MLENIKYTYKDFKWSGRDQFEGNISTIRYLTDDFVEN